VKFLKMIGALDGNENITDGFAFVLRDVGSHAVE
jgi:hypothetical protein